MNDFTKGMLVWAAGVVTFVLFFYCVGRASVYVDNLRTQRIAECKANGYTWGECWNVIAGAQDAFTR